MSTTQEHKRDAPHTVRCAVVTVSDTRTVETDTGGRAVLEWLSRTGHTVTLRAIVPDDPERIRQLLLESRDRADIDAVLLTGGTGITQRDQTYETVKGLLTKELPGYGELFRFLSYQQIGAAAMLSRALGGLMVGTIVLTMPGSPAAVELAMEKIIVPELSHLIREARR